MERERAKGRPRDAGLDESLLAAVLDELGEVGYDALTIDAVATRAGASRPAVYRRWSGKPAMVVDALRAAFQHANPEVPNSGDVQRDLTTLLRNTIVLVTTPPMGAVMRSLVTVRARESELGAVLRNFERERRTLAMSVLRRAKSEGRLRADLSPEAAFDLAFSPVYFRLLVTGDPLHPRMASAWVAVLMT